MITGIWIASIILTISMVIVFNFMFRQAHAARAKHQREYDLCPLCHGKGEVAKVTDPDAWYPGNDGVNTVEDMWRFYNARGDEIVKLRDQLARMN